MTQPTVTLHLTVQEVDALLNAAAHRPYHEVGTLIQKVIHQANNPAVQASPEIPLRDIDAPPAAPSV